MTSVFEEGAAEVLEFLARIRARIGEFQRSLWANFDHNTISSDVEVRRFESGLCIVAWVEQEIGAERAVTWWLEISQTDDLWVVDPEVLLTEPSPQHDVHQEVLIDLEKHSFPTIEAVLRESPRILERLLATDEDVRAILKARFQGKA